MDDVDRELSNLFINIYLYDMQCFDHRLCLHIKKIDLIFPIWKRFSATRQPPKRPQLRKVLPSKLSTRVSPNQR